MESLDLLLGKGLQKLGILEQFKLNTIVHHWKDVVGPIIASHTRIIDIKPPRIVISADTSQWMQEIKMNEKRIIKHINDYYKSDVITEMRLIMQRQSYIKQDEEKPLILEKEIKSRDYIQSNKIVLTDDDVDRIDSIVNKTNNEELKEAFRKLLISRWKKEIHLEQQGFQRCERCHVLMDRNNQYCVSCEYDLYREKINGIKTFIRNYPYCKYGDCKPHINCTFTEFSTAMRELIYFYLDKIYKGSTSRNHMYMAAMLITHKKPDELTDQHVINLCNKYRSKFLDEEKQKELQALRGINEWEAINESNNSSEFQDNSKS
ncbi:DUF721 domain-containing protein [Veillonella agrestimuris]|uniref:DUF721 domain-containing protein n=1 Tax=Veillonella agrestimuris TaxID=2941340 RepID=UPI00203B513E|nr:DUF721 domain-containing protein [Veillonella agrestimuris]